MRHVLVPRVRIEVVSVPGEANQVQGGKYLFNGSHFFFPSLFCLL